MHCLEEALVRGTSLGRCLWQKPRECGGMDREHAGVRSRTEPGEAEEALHQCQLIQNLVDVSVSSLQALRTRCAASNDLTKQEIRTLEVRQRRYAARASLVLESPPGCGSSLKCVQNLPSSCLLEGPVTKNLRRIRISHQMTRPAWSHLHIILMFWLLLPKMATEVVISYSLCGGDGGGKPYRVTCSVRFLFSHILLKIVFQLADV